MWTFSVETSTHALRPMTGGLLDRYHRLTIIIGHMGEAALSDKIGRSNSEELFRLKQPVAVKLKGPSGSA